MSTMALVHFLARVWGENKSDHIIISLKLFTATQTKNGCETESRTTNSHSGELNAGPFFMVLYQDVGYTLTHDFIEIVTFHL